VNHSPPASLAQALRELDRAFDRKGAIHNDPLGCVHALAPEQRELGAHVAAMLSYGAVGQIRKAIGQVWDACDGDLVGASCDPASLRRRLAGFAYRMTSADDVTSLVAGLGCLLEEHGSLAAAFASGDDGQGDIQGPLTVYVRHLRSGMAEWSAGSRGARYLTPDPSTGSAVKRWCMMLRWLARPDDGADLGLWGDMLATDRLVIPLDTHTSRLSWWLGLTTRKTVDFKAARDVTDALRAVDSLDPLRFDMPLCHLGISGACQHRFVESVCSECSLSGLCVFTRALGGKPRLASD
jgi:uncharacterized protein (TIGR02757 family)